MLPDTQSLSSFLLFFLSLVPQAYALRMEASLADTEGSISPAQAVN
jgi:hypothetical protein